MIMSIKKIKSTLLRCCKIRFILIFVLFCVSPIRDLLLIEYGGDPVDFFVVLSQITLFTIIPTNYALMIHIEEQEVNYFQIFLLFFGGYVIYVILVKDVLFFDLLWMVGSYYFAAKHTRISRNLISYGYFDIARFSHVFFSLISLPIILIFDEMYLMLGVFLSYVMSYYFYFALSRHLIGPFKDNGSFGIFIHIKSIFNFFSFFKYRKIVLLFFIISFPVMFQHLYQIVYLNAGFYDLTLVRSVFYMINILSFPLGYFVGKKITGKEVGRYADYFYFICFFISVLGLFFVNIYLMVFVVLCIVLMKYLSRAIFGRFMMNPV